MSSGHGVCLGRVRGAWHDAGSHVVDADVDVLDAEALQELHRVGVRREVLAADVHRAGRYRSVRNCFSQNLALVMTRGSFTECSLLYQDAFLRIDHKTQLLLRAPGSISPPLGKPQSK